jgi:transcriptional regulator with XRE-family HTH domain
MAAAAARHDTAGQPRPRAQDVDRYIGARLRERRMMLGLGQQQTAELIGVTYQQVHKYEKGINRIAAGRLCRIAQALGVEVRYFFEGFGQDEAVKSTPQQRLLLDLARNFVSMPDRRQQEAVCQLARVLAHPEPALAPGDTTEPSHGPAA